MSVQITTHEVPGAVSGLSIQAFGSPSSAGAHNTYDIQWVSKSGYECINEIDFQNGPIPENGNNGVTIEALLAVCEHRLAGFQNGPYPCTENEIALGHIGRALDALKRRTADRVARNVEGKNEA